MGTRIKPKVIFHAIYAWHTTEQTFYLYNTIGTGNCILVISFLFVLGTKGRMEPVVMAYRELYYYMMLIPIPWTGETGGICQHSV